MGTIQIDQVGSMNICYSRYTFDYFLEGTAKMGFKSFELWAGSPFLCYYDSPSNWTKTISEMRKKIDASGLELYCVTGEQVAYFANLATRDKRVRKGSIEYFSNLIRAAAELGSEHYLMSIGQGYYDEPYDNTWNRAIDAAAEVLKVAEKEKVKIIWEVMPTCTTNLINSYDSAKRVCKDLDSEYSGICVDTSAIWYKNETLEKYFSDPELRKKIYHVHLNDGIDDNGWLTWGDGTCDVDVFLNTLAKYDYDRHMTLELGDPTYAADPNGAILRGRNHLLKHMPFTV